MDEVYDRLAAKEVFKERRFLFVCWFLFALLAFAFFPFGSYLLHCFCNFGEVPSVTLVAFQFSYFRDVTYSDLNACSAHTHFTGAPSPGGY